MIKNFNKLINLLYSKDIDFDYKNEKNREEISTEIWLRFNNFSLKLKHIIYNLNAYSEYEVNEKFKIQLCFDKQSIDVYKIISCDDIDSFEQVEKLIENINDVEKYFGDIVNVIKNSNEKLKKETSNFIKEL